MECKEVDAVPRVYNSGCSTCSAHSWMQHMECTDVDAVPGMYISGCITSSVKIVDAVPGVCSSRCSIGCFVSNT